jgi:hypothetical protein
MREVVRGHLKDLGAIRLKSLKAALTAFPRAQEVTLCDGEAWGDGEEEALVEWLCEGGRGRHLTTLRLQGEAAADLVHKALRQGALPSLRAVDANLGCEIPRASLTGGLLGGVQELHLKIVFSCEVEPQLAALGLVRQLLALAKLELKVCSDDSDLNEDGDEHDPVQWPPFISSSLNALSIATPDHPQFLLCALPGMLGAGGAGLERLEGVAGTLTHLHLSMNNRGVGLRNEGGLGYELGVAVGNLRRLQNLTLDLSSDGRAYRAVARGLAAIGGGCPLPLLWRLRVGIESPNRSSTMPTCW